MWTPRQPLALVEDHNVQHLEFLIFHVISDLLELPSIHMAVSGKGDRQSKDLVCFHRINWRTKFFRVHEIFVILFCIELSTAEHSNTRIFSRSLTLIIGCLTVDLDH